MTGRTGVSTKRTLWILLPILFVALRADAVFDLFQDDFGTGTQYDDRFNFEVGADRGRVEPDGDTEDNHQAVADAAAA